MIKFDLSGIKFDFLESFIDFNLSDKIVNNGDTVSAKLKKEIELLKYNSKLTKENISGKINEIIVIIDELSKQIKSNINVYTKSEINLLFSTIKQLIPTEEKILELQKSKIDITTIDNKLQALKSLIIKYREGNGININNNVISTDIDKNTLEFKKGKVSVKDYISRKETLQKISDNIRHSGVVIGGGNNEGGGSGSCSFDGVYQQPSGYVSGTTCQEWIDLHFPSQPPTMSIRSSVSFGLYEVGKTITTPLIEVSGELGANPAGTLTNISIQDPIFSQINPNSGTRYGTNDVDITIVLGTTKTYMGDLTDSESRTANASGSYSGAYPYYGTSSNITTLTKQQLLDNTSSYFQVNMVAETGGGKYKADFESGNINITGVQFYNTVSGNREWMGGSQANSLTLRDTTSVNHTVQSNSIGYTRYTHNGLDGGALDIRFYS